jgi:hypothetical protein
MDGLCKWPEVLHVLVTDRVNDPPVDFSIIVDGDVAKPNGALHSPCERGGQHVETAQGVERSGHRVGRRFFAGGDHMHGDVDAELHGARQVQRQDVLHVVVARERLGLVGALRFDAPDAAAQRFELVFYEGPIHRCRRSFRRRLR